MSSAKWWQSLSQPQMFKGMVLIFQQLRMHPTVHSRYIAVTFLQIIQERTGLKFCLTHEVLCFVQSNVLYCYAIYRKSAVFAFAFISIWIVLSHNAGPGFCWNLSYIVMPYVIDTKCPAYSILHSTLINWANIYLGGGMSPIRCQAVTRANAY